MKKIFVAGFILIFSFLIGCSGFKPGQEVVVTRSATVNAENFSPYDAWYMQHGGCTIQKNTTATVLKKGDYLHDLDTRLYLVQNHECKGWISSKNLSLLSTSK